MYVGYLSGVFDFTGTQMVLTMKLTSFAYNLYDGTADKDNVFPSTPHEDKRKAKVYQVTITIVCHVLPSIEQLLKNKIANRIGPSLLSALYPIR